MIITALHLREHINDYRWLDEHIDLVFKQVQDGLHYDYSAIGAIELINEIMPYALARMDYRRWEPLLQDALLHTMELKDNELQIPVWSHLGICYLQSGRSKTASEAFHKALVHIEHDVPPETNLLARIGMLRAKMFHETSDIAEFIADTLVAARAVDNYRLWGKLHHTLAGIYTHRGETRDALGHSQMALACWYKLGNAEEKTRTLLELAEICRIATRYAQAVRYLSLVDGEAENLYYSAIQYYSQGSVWLESNQLEQARGCFEVALKQVKILDFPHLIGAAHHALGLVQTKQGDYDAARDNLRRALIIWQQTSVQYEQVNGVYALGFLEEKAGNYSMARQLYGEGLKLVETLPPSPMVGGLRAEIIQHLEGLPV